jgi:hypothetical protein
MDKENRSEWCKVRMKPSVKATLQEIQERTGLSQADLIEQWIFVELEWQKVLEEEYGVK